MAALTRAYNMLLRAKRTREDYPECRRRTDVERTRVLLIKGLGAKTSDRDILSLCSEVGVVLSLSLFRSKCEALVEFDSQEAADFCLLRFSTDPVALHNNNITFHYSGRKPERRDWTSPSPSSELVLTVTEVKYPVTIDVIEKVMHPFGALRSINIFPRSFGFQVLVRVDSVLAAEKAHAGLNGQHIYSGCNTIKAEFSPMPALVKEVRLADEDATNVCFLQNISERVTPDMLFNLFSLYGNVMRVKIFYKRRDLGLVQMENHEQAEMARTNLNNAPLFGRAIFVSISRNNCIYPAACEVNASSCRDYTDSAFHRFKFAGSRNLLHRFPPCQSLHLSNISDQVEETFLTRLFDSTSEVVEIRYLGSDRRQAIAKFRSVDDAVRVLVTHHNANLHGRFLKLCFSKTP